MSVNDLLRPRYIVGLITIIIFAVLMYLGTVDQTVGVTVIIGILAALGIYEGARIQRQRSNQ